MNNIDIERYLEEKHMQTDPIIYKFDELSDEMKASVLYHIACEENWMNDTDEYSSDCAFVLEVAKEQEYEITGPGVDDWAFY